MHIIFAVTASKQDLYKKFAAFIGQEENVGLLAMVSNSHVTEKDKLKDLIKKQYDSIRSM